MAATRTKAPRFTGHHVGLLIILAVLASPACVKTNQAAEKVAEVARDAGKAAESWVDWASNKLQKGMGWRHEKAKDKVSAYTSGAASHASETAAEAKETLESKAEEAYAGATKSSKRASDAADRAYDDAKQKASEAYASAKESMTTGAKRSYEAAKEKASKAAGDLGAAMKPDEL